MGNIKWTCVCVYVYIHIYIYEIILITEEESHEFEQGLEMGHGRREGERRGGSSINTVFMYEFLNELN